jgi:hypothetical protein
MNHTLTPAVPGSGTLAVPDDELTFGSWGPGVFAPVSGGGGHFTYSFSGGANTLTGTNALTFQAPTGPGHQTLTAVYTITGGTGLFAGASGIVNETDTAVANPNGTASLTMSGSGQVSAAAIPEPSTGWLLIAGLPAFATVRKMQRYLYPITICHRVPSLFF